MYPIKEMHLANSALEYHRIPYKGPVGQTFSGVCVNYVIFLS